MSLIKWLVLVCLLINISLFAEEGVVIIDNFDKKDLQTNSLNKKVFTFVSHKQLVFNLESDKNGVKNECLKIGYDISSVKSNISGPIVRQIDGGKQKVEHLESPTFAGYFTEVSGIDFTKYDYLVLYVRGDKEKGFSRNLKIELKDKKFGVSYVLEGITYKWQKFVVPIAAFGGINLKKVHLLGIIFSSELMSRKEGVIYIDKIFVAKKSFVKQQSIKVNKRKTLITINGELSDWKNEKWYNLDINNNLEMGRISTSQDLDARFSLCWDENYLYIATKITDNEIICRETGADIWQDDCVEIYMDPQNDGLIWGNEKDCQIGVAPTGPNNEAQIYAWFQDKIPTEEEVVYAVGNYKNGYIIEMKIKWDFLNFSVRENDKLGFSISVQDIDTKDDNSGKVSYCWIKDVDKIFLADVRLK